MPQFSRTEPETGGSVRSLLREHRRLVAEFHAAEARDEELDRATAREVEATYGNTDKAVEVYGSIVDRRAAAREGMKPAIAAVDRKIWTITPTNWTDIVARAELALFWSCKEPGWYGDHHGYCDSYHEQRLVDAVLAVAFATGGVDA